MLLKRKLLLVILCFFIVTGITAPGQARAAAKVLTLAWGGDIGNLNPHKYSGEMFAQGMLFDSLVVYGPWGKILPCLAESWSVSEDGRMVTFRLRRDVSFSDGTPFDAKAAVLNFETVMLNADLHSWMGIFDQIEKVEAADDFTLRLYLKNPFYPVFQELFLIRPFRFLSPKAFPDHGNTSKDIKGYIGTGPWILTDYKKSEYAVFTRNENYWGP